MIVVGFSFLLLGVKGGGEGEEEEEGAEFCFRAAVSLAFQGTGEEEGWFEYFA